MTPDSTHAGRALAGTNEFADAEDSAEARSRMSFLDHLDELRRRLLYSVYAVAACAVVTFYYWDRLFEFYVAYFRAHGGTLVYNQPMAGFMFSLKISALAAVIVAAPFLFSQGWVF